MKKFIALLLTLTLVVGISTAASAATTTYTDVPDTHWASSSIANCTEKGLMQGYEGKFTPEGALTRAEVAQICYNAYKSKLESLITNKTLSDVPADKWYRDAMYWMVANGIINGSVDEKGNTLVYPDAVADRKYVALVLNRLASKLEAELPKTVTAVTFPDISELGKEYQTAISNLQQAGVISGFPDGTYQPNGTLTRAQAAKLFDIYTDIEGLKPTATTAQPEPTPPPATSSGEFDWVNLASTYESDLRPYAESLGFECEYRTATDIVNGGTRWYMYFTKGDIRVSVIPKPASGYYSVRMGRPDDNNQTRIETGPQMVNYQTLGEVKEVLKNAS